MTETQEDDRPLFPLYTGTLMHETVFHILVLFPPVRPDNQKRISHNHLEFKEDFQENVDM